MADKEAKFSFQCVGNKTFGSLEGKDQQENLLKWYFICLLFRSGNIFTLVCLNSLGYNELTALTTADYKH